MPKLNDKQISETCLDVLSSLTNSNIDRFDQLLILQICIHMIEAKLQVGIKINAVQKAMDVLTIDPAKKTTKH